MADKELKEYTSDDVSKHTTTDSCWLIIGNSSNGELLGVEWNNEIRFGGPMTVGRIGENAGGSVMLCVMLCIATTVALTPFFSHHTQMLASFSFSPGGPKVYDVTKYLDDHPGGAEVMLDVAGQNADEFFEDIGHSKEARNELAKYLIGTYKLTEEELAKMKAEAEKKAAAGGSSSMMLIVVVALIAIYVAYTQMNS
jgi:cytochrome b involved in lipid metabolism